MLNGKRESKKGFDLSAYIVEMMEDTERVVLIADTVGGNIVPKHSLLQQVRFGQQFTEQKGLMTFITTVTLVDFEDVPVGRRYRIPGKSDELQQIWIELQELREFTAVVNTGMGSPFVRIPKLSASNIAFPKVVFPRKVELLVVNEIADDD